jgi:cysteine desulfurase
MRSPGIYLDFAGSTPVEPDVAREASRWFESGFGNVAAGHPHGQQARESVERARTSVARALGAAPDEIAFTSGGTESNNWALFGSAPDGGRGHIVVSAIEHKSVLNSARELERRGHALTLLRVGPSGVVDPAEVRAALRPDTFLVSLMLANNETGLVQPVREVAAACRAIGVRVHCDAVAALGKLPVSARELGCDLLSVSAHKLYSPKGCGALFIARGVELRPLIFGCGQQGGRRSGTENTPAVAAFGVACERLAAGDWSELASPCLRDMLWERVRSVAPEAEPNGAGERLPNTLSVSFRGLDASRLQFELAARGVSCTAGSAGAGCAASHVLLAMGAGEARARSTLRFTTGLRTTADEIESAARALDAALRSCRPSNSASSPASSIRRP